MITHVLFTCLVFFAEAQLMVPEMDLVLVSTLEGKVHALDRTGKHFWTFDTARHLVNSYYSEDAFAGSRTAYLITPYGELVSAAGNIFSRADFSIRELVMHCPMIRSEELHVGEKHTRAYLVDPATGELLASYEHLRPDIAHSAAKNGQLLVVFVDYIYQVLNTKTMQVVYNLTYTEILPSDNEAVLVSNLEELDTAIKTLRQQGTVSGLHAVSHGVVSQYALAQTEGQARVKIDTLKPGLVYAKIVEHNTEEDETFPIYIQSQVLMLDGPTAHSVPSVTGQIFAILVIIGTGLLIFRKPKPVTHDKDMNTHFEEPVQKPVIVQKYVGSIQVDLNTVLGHGSQGTTVFEGFFQGRIVAVKRMLKSYLGLAKQEIALLLKADAHPNVVTFYSWEEDDTFVYIAFEKCCGTLETLVQIASVINPKKRRNAMARLNFATPPNKLQLLQDAARGLAYLHSLNIVHRDIKPMNILIDTAGTAKIADMASGKTLLKDESSFGTQAHGSAGWQAAEVLRNERRTKAVDIFSLGCTMYYTLTDGFHPFGGRVQRDHNILSNLSDLSMVSIEAQHLLKKMIAVNPAERPPAAYVYQHCLFWSADTKLNFLQDLSDRLEAEGNESSFALDLEYECRRILRQPWNETIDPLFLQNIAKYRKYDFNSVKDLLRVIRNKKHHYHELPQTLKTKLGGVPEGFFEYFNNLYPTLFTRLFEFVEARAPDPLYAVYIKL